MKEITVTKEAEYEVTGWAKYITFTYEGKEYSVKLLWNEHEGYEIVKGWAELPDELTDEVGDFCNILDEITYIMGEKASIQEIISNTEGVNA